MNIFLHFRLPYLKSINLALLMMLFLPMITFGQVQLDKNWRKQMLQKEGKDKLALIFEVVDFMANENLPLADSLGKIGILGAYAIGDSLKLHAMGIKMAKISKTLNNLDEGLQYANGSLRYFNGIPNSQILIAKSQLAKADLLLAINQYRLADSLIALSKKSFEAQNDLKGRSESEYLIGKIHFKNKDYGKANVHFDASLDISAEVKQTEVIAKSMSKKAAILHFKGQYPEALDLLFSALTMQVSSLTKVDIYSNICRIYGVMEDYDQALRYIKISMALEKKIGLEYNLSENLRLLGIYHKKQFNYGEALKKLKESLAIKEKNSEYPGFLLGTIGNTYYAMNEIYKGDEIFNEYLLKATRRNDVYGICNVYINQGQQYFKTKQYNKSLEYFLKSHEFALEKNILPLLLVTHESLSENYYSIGDMNKAKFHEEQHQSIEEELLGFDRIKKVGAIEQKYIAIDENDGLDKDNQNLVIKNGKSNTSQPIKSSVFIILLSVGVFIFLYFLYKKYKISSQDKLNDQNKIDDYFKQLFNRMDSNDKSGVGANNRIDNDDIPIKDMTEFLKTNLTKESDWTSFEHYFEKIHKDFYKNLKTSCPTISTKELNICAFLKLNILNKDIAKIMGINPDSVRKAQNRLSKKLNLLSSQNLRDYVLKL